MPKTSRTRSARAVANDSAIRDAAIDELMRVGVDHLSLRDVSHRAGLTHGATYARYEDFGELLVDLWISRLGERIHTLFDLCLNAAKSPGAESAAALFTHVKEAGPNDVAAIQLLLTARRLPTLLEEVEIFIKGSLEAEDTKSPDASPEFTRALTLFAMMVAEIFADAYLGRDEEYQSIVEGVLLEVLETDPRTVPVRPFTETLIHDTAPTSNDLRSQLAWATFLVVGRSGYTRATISRIARRANCSPGAIYKLHDSKEDLVATSFRELMRARWMRASNFVRVLEEDAISKMLYRATSPEHSVRRAFTTEFALAAPYNELLLNAIQDQTSGLAKVVNSLENASDDEKKRVNHLIRAMTYLTVGASMLATVSTNTQCANFAQFAEPFRLAILKGCLPTWNELRSQIADAAQSAGVR
ncbi:MAG: TetR/AcrR family transcriptional regulator [Acidobacteriota bacterium]|nr:TetR/AcrR family transcriptional regulator [Acidobacteriota bacterium]